MSRRMSCSMTVPAVRARTKTVTRRHVDTWKNLQVGDRLTLIEKGMGLPKGARQVVLAEVEIVAVRVEELGAIFTDLKDEDRWAGGRTACFYEGLPDMHEAEFVRFWLDSHGYRHLTVHAGCTVFVRRIEWRYLDGQEGRPWT